MAKPDIKSLTLPELTAAMELLGEKPFRGKQVFAWLHQKRAASFPEMTDLPLALRQQLEAQYAVTALTVRKKLVSRLDGTVKYLFGLADGNAVEAVLMRYRHGNTLCVSTQVGCRMGCAFCASTVGGLVRNLTASEMLEEVYRAEADSGEKVDGVVLMGIGEPLDNFEHVTRFLELLSCPRGKNLSLRHVSLSTCGLVDKIDLLAAQKLGLTLSVSLHAPNDEARNRTMPVNRKWPVEELLAACRRYFAATGRRVSFEYALIAGENDAPEHARELGQRLRGMNCHVNLIPVNAVEGKGYRASQKERVDCFAGTLSSMGVTTTVRRRLGADIEAACGQLRRREAGL